MQGQKHEKAAVVGAHCSPISDRAMLLMKPTTNVENIPILKGDGCLKFKKESLSMLYVAMIKTMNPNNPVPNKAEI